MIAELTITTKILFSTLWVGGSIGVYYLKYGRKNKIEIMSVAPIERKYRRMNEQNKGSIF